VPYDPYVPLLAWQFLTDKYQQSSILSLQALRQLHYYGQLIVDNDALGARAHEVGRLFLRVCYGVYRRSFRIY
jgi:hypothetical protein